jgi:hypothetical protein
VLINCADFYSSVSQISLGADAKRMLNAPNAGGSSVMSEVLSCELMCESFSASLQRTEMEIEYWPPNSKKTDYSVSLFGRSIGVSVTRAWKLWGEFSIADAQSLLYKKLNGIAASSSTVIQEHGWQKQILHVWTAHSYIAHVLAHVFENDPECEPLRQNTVLMITVSHNADWIYKQPADVISCIQQ